MEKKEKNAANTITPIIMMHDVLKNGFHFERTDTHRACSLCLQWMACNRANWTWLVNFPSIMDFYLSNEKVLAHLNCWNQNPCVCAPTYTEVERERDGKKRRNRDVPLPKIVDASVQSIEPKANQMKIKSAVLIVLFSMLMLFLDQRFCYNSGHFLSIK